MRDEPDYYDARIAGWWCWGLCAWIGGGGVHRKLPHLGNAGKGECARRAAVLRDWMLVLADRLRNVRVCCGDWLRVCNSESTTTRHGITAVVLDPPYSAEAGRDNAIYAHEELERAGWSVLDWIAQGGYANMGDGADNENFGGLFGATDDTKAGPHPC